MGLFLQTAILPECGETQARNAVEAVAKKLGGLDKGEKNKYEFMNLIPEECQYKEQGGGTSILFNEECGGFEDLAEAISKETQKPILLLYIYDGDFWGYSLYDNGVEIDRFNPMPDYFEEASEAQMEKEKGNAEIIAKYFHVEKADIEKYLIFWTDELLESEDGQKAYEDDEFSIGEDWQMADFMRKLGYPYENFAS